MSTATVTTAPVASPVSRGFGPLPCLECGKTDCVAVRLHDVGTFHCEECDAELTLDEVRERLDQWARVVAWVELAPALPE